MNDVSSLAMRGAEHGFANLSDDSRLQLEHYRATSAAAPHSLEAEQAVLGALLLEPQSFERIRDAISSDDFFAHVHRSIFDAIVGCLEARTPVDLFTVAEHLRNAGELEAIGGHVYLLTLTNTIGSAAGIKSYAEILHGKARLRSLLSVADQIRESAFRAANAEEAVGDAGALLAELASSAGFTPRRASPKPLDLRQLSKSRAPPKAWIRQGWLGNGAMLIAGKGGDGKSTLVLHEAVCGSIGRAYFAPACEPYASLVWNCEDESEDQWRAVERVCDHEQISMDDLDGRLHLISRYGCDNALMAEIRRGVLEPTRLLAELRQQVNDLHVRMLWLDNLAHVMLGDHDDRTQVTQFINALNGLVTDRPFSVGLVGHVSRGQGSEFSGSVAWENAVRMRWYLGPKLPDQVGGDEQPATESAVRFLAKRKSNYSARDYVRMEMRDGLLIPDGAATDHVSGLVSAMDERRAEEVCIAGFRSLCEMGIRTTDGKTTGDYLPSQLLSKGLAAGYSKADLGKAMNRLMGRKVFVRGVIGKHTNRSDKFGLILSEGIA